MDDLIPPDYPLALFHPLIRQWFQEKLGSPSDIQRRAWPAIAAGHHLLITAPTGSGKTLTAFLWAINRFITIPARTGGRVLYISPLKALNNDIRRNLEEPLEDLRTLFSRQDLPFPVIRVAVRSGDSDPRERRRQVQHPPEILITTPESLNILLASAGGQRLLTGLATVILDEIHAVAGTKRGVYLMSAVERLAFLTGEFQRLALSATVQPAEEVASLAGGWRLTGRAGNRRHEPRPVQIVRSPVKKQTRLDVIVPADRPSVNSSETWWNSLVDECLRIIRSRQSTLFFANSRRLVEKLTRLINERAGEDLAYSHHGSLSREIRTAVETRFKDGELRAIVATSSLELGIDIGSVDQVVLMQPPPGVAAGLQRVGRSGHRLDQVSRGTFLPLHPLALINDAVLARAMDEEAIEPVRPLENCLDILAQLILSMTLLQERPLDEVYDEIRCCRCYRNLPRREFDLVVEMLAGRYAGTRLRELNTRLVVDPVSGTGRARPHVARLLYLSGGVIPDRGYYTLRVADSKAKIGELDEEFVWERSVGESFPLGNQTWRIERITHNDVEVTPAGAANAVIPFWRAENMNRSFPLSERILVFLEEAGRRMDEPGFRELLVEKYHLTEAAADELLSVLERQRVHTRTELPHRHHLLVEHYRDPSNQTGARQTILHTGWGGGVNRPLAFVLAAAWEKDRGQPLQTFVSDDCLLLNLPAGFAAGELPSLVKPGQIRRLLRESLESTAWFGALFQENAQRALLLPRQSFHRRMPLWLNRLRARKLLAVTGSFEDFPLVLETWRDCLQNSFDLESLERLWEEVAAGEIRITETFSQTPSPFAAEVAWRQTNFLMYEDDSPASKFKTNLSENLLREVLESPKLRPKFSRTLLEAFQAKLQRTAPGYAPSSPAELLHWVRERQFIPLPEWNELLDAVSRDHGRPREAVLEQVLPGIHFFEHDGRPHAVGLAEETVRLRRLLDWQEPVSAAADEFDPGIPPSDAPAATPGPPALAGFLAAWLAFYGPVSRDFLLAALRPRPALLDEALEQLAAEERILVDQFREDAAGPDLSSGPTVLEICDRENVEILLRLRRKAARPSLAALPLEALPLFFAALHRLPAPGDEPEFLQSTLDRLLGFPARAECWERDFLPARLPRYTTAGLDEIIAESGLVWAGCDRGRITFTFPEELSVFLPAGDGHHPPSTPAASLLEDLFRDHPGRLGLAELERLSGLDAPAISQTLWELVWQGRLTGDGIRPLRQGILNRFQYQLTNPGPDGRPAPDFGRWRRNRAGDGLWQLLPASPASGDGDALTRMELRKERCRQLMLRYGVIFRELLFNELPALRWREIFPALRLLELSGELVTGRFFTGVPGVQFASPEAVHLLETGLPEEASWWISAADPLSPCGSGLPCFGGLRPPRLPGNHLVFQGRRLMVVSKQEGRELLIPAGPEDPALPGWLSFLKILISRSFLPLKQVRTETVNGEPVLTSPYRDILREIGFRPDYRGLVLERRW